MATDIVKKEGSTEVTNLSAAGGMDAYEAFGNSVTNRNIVGTLLKFNKGDWLIGEDAEELPRGTILIANMPSLQRGWIRWQDNKPDQHIMGPIDGPEGSFTPPRRSELGDLDKDQWEEDQNGNPRDPWQESFYLQFFKEGTDPEDEENIYTFAASSAGTRGAIGELAKAYGKNRRMHPTLLPKVALEVDSYQHRNKEYGRIKVPVFKIEDFVDPTAEPPKQVTSAAAKKTPAKKPAAKK